jgi:hypothetical protein
MDKRSSSRPKTVWVRFPGAASAGRASDTVLLDSAAPRLRRVSAQWRTSWWSWVLTIRAVDQDSGLAKVEVGSSRHQTRSVAWGRPVNDVDSSKLRWVRVIDRAGNASRWYHLRI